MNVKDANFELIQARKEGRAPKPEVITFIAGLQDSAWGIVSGYYGPNRAAWVAVMVFTLGLIQGVFETKLKQNNFYTYGDISKIVDGVK